MQGHSHSKAIPPLIHVVNIVALLLTGLILLLTAVAHAYQVVVLLPVLVLLVVYWRFRTNPRVAAGYFGLAIGLLGWILIFEHIVTIENIFGSQITRRLSVGLRLQSYIADTLHVPDRVYLEACCDDPLTWRYQLGSTYRKVFDCSTCGKPYEIVADESGHLNQQSGLMQRHEQIDLFLAGDSLLQGHGVPSVLESIRTQIPLRMWNLSIAGYGARQKVNALITYALPKQPTWLIVEFLASNDLEDAVRDEACDSVGDFRCRHNTPEVRRQLSKHPFYQTIFEIRTDVFAKFADVATKNLTLATTRYLITMMKGAIKERLMAEGDLASVDRDKANKFYNTDVVVPPGESFTVREGQSPVYLKTAMSVTEQHYMRLWKKLEGMDPKPTVILLYNPTPYEIYRGIWMDLIPQAEGASAFQREALSAFAHAHGWRFLDLTDPLRQEVQARQVWLFGQYDKGHWSPEGTTIVAAVLSRELRKMISQGEATRATR